MVIAKTPMLCAKDIGIVAKAPMLCAKITVVVAKLPMVVVGSLRDIVYCSVLIVLFSRLLAKESRVNVDLTEV